MRGSMPATPGANCRPRTLAARGSKDGRRNRLRIDWKLDGVSSSFKQARPSPYRRARNAGRRLDSAVALLPVTKERAKPARRRRP